MIRPARPDELETLAALACHVFVATYTPQGLNAAIAAELRQRFAPDCLARRLADPRVRMLVAEEAGWLHGFADLNLRAQGPGVQGGELLRLYVQPAQQGRGLGAGLLSAAEAVLREAGERCCWLSAWEGNARALAFYPRHGYTDIGETDYRIDGVAYRNRVFHKALH